MSELSDRETRETSRDIAGMRMPKSEVKLPATLPGEFFVLECLRDSGRFRLHVDDADVTIYNLGSNIQVIMRQFCLWGLQDIGYRSIDIAKEFGACQTIPSQNRTIATFDRPSDTARKKIRVDFDKEERNNGSAKQLPALRG